MTANSDPWSALEPPRIAGQLNARRVDALHPWNFFWATDRDAKCIMLMRHGIEPSATQRLPKLREVEITQVPDGNGYVLMFRLLTTANKEVFHRFCMDVVERASTAQSENEAVDVTLMRTWRWQHLLKGGGNNRLSPEQQKGLIAELLCLNTDAIPVVGDERALMAWGGPLGHAKDFEFGATAVECKAKQGGSPAHIHVSSEYQLDPASHADVFLFVASLDRSTEDDMRSFTLTDKAREIRDAIADRNLMAVDHFEALLLSAGFLWEHDYTDYRWTHTGTTRYVVGERFPALYPSIMSDGVFEVEYSLALSKCDEFIVDRDFALNRIAPGDTND